MTEAQRVIHELNNALMAINGYAEIVLARLPDADPLRVHVDKILTAGLHAADLTRILMTRPE
jgi:signal transduction histidine kinase